MDISNYSEFLTSENYFVLLITFGSGMDTIPNLLHASMYSFHLVTAISPLIQQFPQGEYPHKTAVSTESKYIKFFI